MPALIWLDNFDSYAVGPLPAPWTSGTNVAISTTQKHSGANSCANGTGGNPSTTQRPLGAGYSNVVLDYWLYLPTGNGIGITNTCGVGLIAASGNPFYVAINQDGTGSVKSGAPTLFTYSAITLDTWHHFVCTVLFAASGTCILTIDGTQVGTFTGDTRIDGSTVSVTNAWMHGALEGGSPPSEFYVDDLTVSDNSVVAAAVQARAMVLA